MAALPSSDLHLQLKKHTQDIHQALHHNPLLSRLTAHDCERSEYLTILQVFYAFYYQSEERFKRVSRTKFSTEAPVISWLQQDFKALGETAVNSLQPIANSISSTDFSRYIGYLYVKQGSTLGGQVLCRQLQKSLVLTPEKGLRFFYGYGDETRLRWRDLQTYLEYHQPNVNISAAVNSACEHFRQLEILLNNTQGFDRLTHRGSFASSSP